MIDFVIHRPSFRISGDLNQVVIYCNDIKKFSCCAIIVTIAPNLITV